MTYLVIVVTILLVVLTVVWVVIGLSFAAFVRRAGELQTRAEYVLNNTEPVVKIAQGLVAELRTASNYITQGTQNLTAITEMAKDEAAEVRSLLGDTTALARREVERTRERVDRVQQTLAVATDQFQQTTALVQQSVLQPAREFSYIMYGLRRGLEVLMAGNRLPVNRAYQDEELFI